MTGPADDQDEVVMVVFGAGASYDWSTTRDNLSALDTPAAPAPSIAGPDRTLRPRPLRDVLPPLTRDLCQNSGLAADLLAEHPRCIPLVGELRSQLADPNQVRTLEQLLGDYQDGAVNDPPRSAHVMAFRFYLQELLWQISDYLTSPVTGNVTNYTRALTHLIPETKRQGKRLALVTFNYDLLLDRACHQHWNFNPDNRADYVTSTRPLLFRPHGAVHWEWELGGHGGNMNGSTQNYQWVLENAAALDDTACLNHAHLKWNDARKPWDLADYKSTGPRIPAIALPLADKDTLIWPPEQEIAFASLAGKVTQLITIGWRGTETTFMDRLRTVLTPNAPVTVIGHTTDFIQVAADLSKSLGRTHPINEYGEGFSNAITSGFLTQLVLS